MALALVVGVAAAPAATFRDADVYARVTARSVVLGNGVAERRWSRARLRTTALVDKRRGGRAWTSARSADFELNVAGVALRSSAFRVRRVGVTKLARGGLRITMSLVGPPGLQATRTAEAYPGIAGFRTQTVLAPSVPLALSGVTLEQAAVGSRAAPTIHAFRAGSDWRAPGYTGPPVGIGDQHPGDWRDTRTAAPGEPLEAPGEWVSAAASGRGGRSLFMAAEENDFPSARADYDGRRAALELDYARDVISLGPLEEDGHVENPAPGPAGRQRLVAPGAKLPLPAVFTGFGDHAGDEPWQFHRYLTEHRLAAYPHAVVFNSDGTDSNRISTGAKDDMNFATVQQVAPIARRLGVETFVLDDGWQAASGDWQPDSPEHPEPRGIYPPRFPDATFAAVRAAIAPMRLGLWMSPVHFNPAAETYKQHPEWGCTPTGQGTAIANLAQPGDGSNEAGIGQWSPQAFPHVEQRIRDAIDNWGVRYFKFDFMIWLDCAGAGDLHDYHDAFLAMLDRVQRDHPDVTFQTDETNDYRLFPFESVSRGPTWFQNGKPEPDLLLHNLWQLSPYVPASALGQHILGGDAWKRHPVDTLMAAALPSHMTFISDIRQLPDDVVARAADWISFYKAHRENFTQLVYPLVADPMADGWTALQSWNPDTGAGALLAFRQKSDERVQTIRLRNVPPGRRFRLVNAPDGTSAGTVTSKGLREGLRIELPAKDGARVIVIEPA
jgi:hypothetical protein